MYSLCYNVRIKDVEYCFYKLFNTMHAPKNRLVKREKMLILLPILLPVYETIITGKSEPCLVLGVRR